MRALLLVSLAFAAACTEPEGDYRIPWEARVGDGPWERLLVRTPPVRGEFVVRARLPEVKGPAPALHLWHHRMLVQVTLDGVPLPRAFEGDSYLLLPPDHAGRLVEATYRSRGWLRYSRYIGEVGPAFELWTPWARLELPGFSVGALLVLLGLALFVAGTTRRGGASPWARLGLFSAPLGVVFIADTRFASLLFHHAETWRLATGIAIFLFPAGLALFVDGLFGDGPARVLRRASWVCLGLLVVGLAFDLLGVALIESVNLVVYVVLLVIVGQSLRRAWPQAKAGERSARAFLAGLSVAIGVALPDIAVAWGVGSQVVPLAPWGQLAFVFAMGVAIEAQFQDNRRRLGEASEELAARLEALEARTREVQALNAELRRQVAERSHELEKALGGALTPMPGSTALQPGELFAGRFRIVRLLGVGGMGAVYEVTRLSDSKTLALKVMTGAVDADAARRFAREAEIAARVQHARLVSVLDVGVTDSGTLYLAMELVTGKSLESQHARYGDPAWALPLLADVAEGLAVLHAAGVVHRDLKPANVLLEPDSSGRLRAKIADFGIARWSAADGEVDPLADTQTPGSTPVGAHQTLTRSGMVMGTPVYMAPELARGAQRAQPSSDVFGFAVMAWEVLTRQRPFTGPPIFFVLAGKPLDVPTATPAGAGAAGALLLAALDVEPQRRPTAAQLASALRAAAG
ncbi:MAG: serine/threonine protein kinase [Myxococcaceae bacterium]|nr:serine/threonine protein kinase [Myxococcaceae bacterium]